MIEVIGERGKNVFADFAEKFLHFEHCSRTIPGEDEFY